MSMNLKSLIGKLNETTRNHLEAAAGLCVTRTHYDVEIEHYLVKALEASGTDAGRILDHFGVDKSRLQAELTRSDAQMRFARDRASDASDRAPKELLRAPNSASPGAPSQPAP